MGDTKIIDLESAKLNGKDASKKVDDTVDNCEGPDENVPWELTKALASLGCGAAAGKLVNDILANLVPVLNGSKLTRIVYTVGIFGISGAVGTAIARYTQEDLSGFDDAIKIIRDYRKELE